MNVLRVTFDTNTLDHAVGLERRPDDLYKPEHIKVHEALRRGRIQGFFSDTIATLEGVQKKDRTRVYGTLTRRHIQSRTVDLATGDHVIRVRSWVEYPERKPLHDKTLDRLQAALDHGMRAIGLPRVGYTRIEDPNGMVYVTHPDEASLEHCLEVSMAVADAIEMRGVGYAQIKQLRDRFAARDNVPVAGLQNLGRARNEQERKEVQDAIAEWADGDSIAAHAGYGIDIFCTKDRGENAKRAKRPSVFDETNRVWLQSTYGVRFVDLVELADMV